MWDLPRLRIKPVFPALAGGLLPTGPPGKSLRHGSIDDPQWRDVGEDLWQFSRLFATPRTAASQASRSLLKLKPIELVMPSNHLIPCRRLLLQPYGVVLLAEFSQPAKVSYIFAKHKQHRRVWLTVCFFCGRKFNQRFPGHRWPSALGAWCRAPFFLTSQSPCDRCT